MREMDAFEQAYKNGYAAGMKAAEEKIVRCKDCENHRWYTNRYGVEISTCTLLCVDVGVDDFCSYGERREDG